MSTKSGYTTVVLRRAAKDGYTPTIGSNGNWFIGGTDTGRTSKGDNGYSPQIGENGNWWEYDAAQGKYTDTGIKAHGTDAKSPYVNESGNWMLWDDTKQEYVDSKKTSRGDDGNAPRIGDDGYWYEYDATTKQYKKTDTKAKGDKGDPSTVPGPTGPTGCVIRQLGEWKAGTYYNDSKLDAPRTNEDNRYIDIVYKKGQDGNPIFYKVKDSVKSTNTTPPNTEYWAEVQQTELTATKVLLANNAYIAMTQGNALHLQCNGSTPHFTAGAAGGTESEGKHSGYAFWAGTNTTGIPTDAQKAAAPFSVDHNGAMKASKGTIAGFNITATNFWSGVDSNALVDGYDQVYIGPKDLIINSESTGYFVYNNGSKLRELCVSGGYNNPSTGVFNVMSSSEGEAVRITNAKQTVATGIGLFLNGFTTALKMNAGCISGAAFKTQTCKSNTKLSLGVNAVAITSACTVTFPSVLGAQDDVYGPNNDGYVLNVKRLHGGSSNCYVTADSEHFIIYTDNEAYQKETTTLAIEGQGDAMMFIFFANVGSTTIKKSDGQNYKGAWIQWKNPREW